MPTALKACANGLETTARYSISGMDLGRNSDKEGIRSRLTYASTVYGAGKVQGLQFCAKRLDDSTDSVG